MKRLPRRASSAGARLLSLLSARSEPLREADSISPLSVPRPGSSSERLPILSELSSKRETRDISAPQNVTNIPHDLTRHSEPEGSDSPEAGSCELVPFTKHNNDVEPDATALGGHYMHETSSRSSPQKLDALYTNISGRVRTGPDATSFEAPATGESLTREMTCLPNIVLNPEDAYMQFIFERICASEPTRFVEHREALDKLFGDHSRSLYQDVACYCAEGRRTGAATELLDSILCAMQEVHEKCEVPWYDSRTGFTGRMLVKFSQMTESIPSILFVKDVAHVDQTYVSAMGSFADVYTATMLGRKVALKRLRAAVYEEDRPEKIFKTLFREALLWRQLRHPSVLPLIGLDKWSFPGTICMVSPWMGNGDMTRYLRRHPDIDIRQRASWVQQISAGLAYLHRELVIHGDFRGANILVDEQLNIRISDFGLSLLSEAGMLTMGMSSWCEGAKRWMAPEVLQSGRCTMEGDVYSFGCVCLEVIYDKIPFDHLKELQVIRAVVSHGELPVWPGSTDRFKEMLGMLVEECWTRESLARPDMQTLQQRITSLWGLIDDAYQ